VTRRLPSKVLARLDDCCEVDRHEGDRALAPEELRRRVAGRQALVCLLTDRIDREAIDAGRDLKVIANVAVGYDNIDVAQARARGIVVTNTPDVLTESVAEFTWGLILAVARRLGEAERLLRRGGWKGWALDFMLGTELRGKQLGIVGMGRIGRAVATRAPAFGMTVAYHTRGTGVPPALEASADRRPPSHTASADRRSLGEGGSLGGGGQARPGDALQPRRVSLDELLVTSDVLSIHLALTPETRHLIDQRALARMKRSAYLINTARGPIVDEAALAWALRERLIAGAALDVFEREPDVYKDLLGLENVVLAPHLGSATREARTAMADLAVSNVLAVLEGKPALTPVPLTPA
jgi:glyoxylate reductase